MRTEDLDALIQEVMRRITEGDTCVLHKLRNQFESATITKIDFDGYGFYAYMAPSEKLRIRNKKMQAFEISDVVGFNDDGRPSVGFILFVRDGLIFMLEGFPFLEDAWPSEEINFKYGIQPPMSDAAYSDTRHLDASTGIPER